VTSASDLKGLAPHIIALEHVGYVVEDISEAVRECSRLYGIDASHVRIVPPLDVADVPTRFAFVKINDAVEFELIEPCSESFKTQLNNPASGPGGINHLAYRVSDIEAAASDLAAQGIRPGHVTPEGVVETGSSKILYLDPRDTGGVLIELIEKPGE